MSFASGLMLCRAESVMARFQEFFDQMECIRAVFRKVGYSDLTLLTLQKQRKSVFPPPISHILTVLLYISVSQVALLPTCDTEIYNKTR